MKIIDYIIGKRRERLLARMASLPHKKRLPSLDEVHSIGLVLPPTVGEDDKHILQLFKDHMVKRDIVVAQYHLPVPGDKESTTRLGVPTAAHLSAFSSHSYDILIAVSPANEHNTLFATLSTPTALRIAYDDTTLLPSPLATTTFDLFIRDKGPCNLTDYLREILILLTRIEK